MKLPHRTPEDSISLPPGVDFRCPTRWHETNLEQRVARLQRDRDIGPYDDFNPDYPTTGYLNENR